MADNARNSSPLRPASPSAQKGGHEKIAAAYSTVNNTGLLFLFRLFLPGPNRIPLTFYRPILRGSDLLHTAPPLPRLCPPHPPGLAIRTIIIQNGRGFGLAQAIQAVECRGFDVMLLTETKTQLDAYSHNRLSYDVTCLEEHTSSARGNQGGVGLVTRERPAGWGIEHMCFHGTNMVICKIVNGHTRTPLFGTYLPP